MRISQLTKRLNDAKKTYGDIECFAVPFGAPYFSMEKVTTIGICDRSELTEDEKQPIGVKSEERLPDTGIVVLLSFST